jgi:hypothetical protein
MKSLLILCASVALITLSGFDYAGGIDSFTASPDGDGITLQWHSEVENGLKSYAIERSALNANNFQQVGSVYAAGNYTYYKYHDPNVSAAPLAGQSGNVKPLSNAYTYRLRINLTDGELSYSQTVNVTSPASGVKRTWGMIKEMFH